MAKGLIDEVSLSDAVALLALNRCGQPDAGQLCQPLAASAVPYAPTDSFLMELMESLRESGFIAISDQSDPGSVQLIEDHIAYDPSAVSWALIANDAAKLTREIEFTGLSGQWPSPWVEEVAQFW